MSWRFHPMLPGEMNVDPFEGEFFATEALDGIADALVREAIQNSLDAATEDVIRVRFRLAQAAEETGRRYLTDLWLHPEAVRGTSDGTPLPGQGDPLHYLVVEDEGVTDDGPRRRFDAELALDGLGPPPDASLFVEAYHGPAHRRFDFGTVGAPCAPSARWLDGIPVRKPLFRVKVVLPEGGVARILAAADRIVPEDSDRDEQSSQSLLPVEYEDLGDRIWALDFDGDWPRLRLDRRFEGIRESARSGSEFLTLVYLEVLRTILERALGEDRFDPDSDDWGTLWLRFACRTLGRPRSPAEDGNERETWIDEAVNAFCARAKVPSRFERLLAERDSRGACRGRDDATAHGDRHPSVPRLPGDAARARHLRTAALPAHGRWGQRNARAGAVGGGPGVRHAPGGRPLPGAAARRDPRGGTGHRSLELALALLLRSSLPTQGRRDPRSRPGLPAHPRTRLPARSPSPPRRPVQRLPGHGEQAALRLSTPINRENSFHHEFAARQAFISNPTIIGAASLLYLDERTRRPKRRAQDPKGGPGTLRRFVRLVQQLDLNYDLHSMSAEALLALLPDEFDAWRKRRRRRWPGGG